MKEVQQLEERAVALGSPAHSDDRIGERDGSQTEFSLLASLVGCMAAREVDDLIDLLGALGTDQVTKAQDVEERNVVLLAFRCHAGLIHDSTWEEAGDGHFGMPFATPYVLARLEAQSRAGFVGTVLREGDDNYALIRGTETAAWKRVLGLAEP